MILDGDDRGYISWDFTIKNRISHLFTDKKEGIQPRSIWIKMLKWST